MSAYHTQPYFSLIIRETDGVWRQAFGAYEFEDVDFERDCYQDEGYLCKIITTGDTAASIDQAVDDFNMGESA